MKKIAIIGATGSIGTQTLDVIRQHPEAFEVVGLTAQSRVKELASFVEEFKPAKVAVGSKEKAKELQTLISTSTTIVYGEEGLMEVAVDSGADIVLMAIIGSAGILPTIEALQAGKDVAIANKETLVAAGEIVIDVARRSKGELIAVDSEHSAIFQALSGQSLEDVSRLIVTASGGAFRDKTREEMAHLTAIDALKHPNWAMGDKITIDSATLMNKGFEVMEAHWLFDISYDKIDVLVHKESYIHSIVEYHDGSMMAQLGAPDMRVAIQYALHHPRRLKSDFKRLDWTNIATMHFEQPDFTRFPCLRYCYEAGRAGGTMPAVLNASNEVANARFREGKIGFLDIEKVIYETMAQHTISSSPSLEEILAVDEEARRIAEGMVKASQG
ncbi:1-deoxy-D-xylulose-5-phosphate reductoisomerase [Aureibacillus halotolerans]|uniref:1-deoxy-D-xylulose 5-phosphate reductoisomerase n=1 Tax=Aureibacillus halotolerans TaxID=1508390 RepID=A0A4R6TT02_9BACI|nr:1-deoxy-D-xylulose-5-phosphate reductoisomerase [Aureibacillus halotolerans]TDQ36780.1 1-deoxy-D-xylulose 5-phosphate reductoisomerase [Aureibacillus halotolerans]